MSEERVKLAVTLGDPAGIGPEIVGALLAQGKLGGADLYLIGSAVALERVLPDSLAGGFEIVPGAKAGTLGCPSDTPIVIDTAAGEDPPLARASAAAGLIAGRAVEIAAGLARRGSVEGIVTGPISKEALRLAGFSYRGHTDMLSELFESPDCQMMMVAGRLRITILTRDMPLREVPASVTAPRLRTGIRVTAESLRELWDIESPRIAVAALNPHGGDGGVTGGEERDVVIPVLGELAHEWYRVAGPFPADTLFHGWHRKDFDAYVALYHDQGMVPFKLGAFESGVNVTVGLPVVRTSVCHGTAFDIAGTGACDTGSMEAAFSLAVDCCRSRRRRTGRD